MSQLAASGGLRVRIGALVPLSDERLARRATKGDERAFAAIYRRYHQDLYRFCLAIVGNSQDAQDALQNTMVKALRALPGEGREIELKPWLYRVANNESIEILRRRRPTEELDPEQGAGGSGLAEDAEVRERLRRLLADLDHLPARQRGALVMRELSGLDYAEIAAALDITQAVARQTLYEARLALRRMEAGHEMSCESVTRTLSEADGRVARRREVRAHLRTCPDCRRFRDELEARRGDLAALSPLPLVAAAGLLQGIGGGGGAAGAGLAGAAGGVAAKSFGVATAVKSAAAVAVVAAVGVGAADRGGMVDIVPGGDSAKQAGQRERSAGLGSGAAAATPHQARVGSVHAQSEGRPPVGQAAPAVEAAPASGEEVPGTAAETTAVGAEAPVASDPNAPATQAPGREQEKQHPAAAKNGQQTAASRESESGGGGRGKGRGNGRSAQSDSERPPKSNGPTKAGGGKAAHAEKVPAEPGSVAQPPAQPPGQTESPRGNPHPEPDERR